MAPGKRQQVSMPSLGDTGHGYLTTLLSGRLEGPLLDRRLVQASYPFINIISSPCLTRKTSQERSSLRSWSFQRPGRNESRAFWCPKQRRGEDPLLALGSLYSQ